MRLVGNHFIRKGCRRIHFEDLGLSFDAKGVCAMSDLGDINIAGSHCGDFCGASLELHRCDRKSHFIKVSLIHSGEQRRCRAQIRHISHPYRCRCVGRLSALCRLCGRSRLFRGGSCCLRGRLRLRSLAPRRCVLSAAGGKCHHTRQHHRCQNTLFLHSYLPENFVWSVSFHFPSDSLERKSFYLRTSRYSSYT